MNNISRFYIQHQNNIRECLLTFCEAFFVVMCLWCATVVFDQCCLIYEEKTAFKVMFVQDAVDGKRKEDERKAYVKKWSEKNPQLAGIMAAK